MEVTTQAFRSSGGTALYDAVYLACKEKLLKTGDERPVRRAIIVLSDGEDNQSQMSLGAAIQMAQRAEVVIYAISTDDSGLVLRGDVYRPPGEGRYPALLTYGPYAKGLAFQEGVR